MINYSNETTRMNVSYKATNGATVNGFIDLDGNAITAVNVTVLVDGKQGQASINKLGSINIYGLGAEHMVAACQAVTEFYNEAKVDAATR